MNGGAVEIPIIGGNTAWIIRTLSTETANSRNCATAVGALQRWTRQILLSL